MTTITPTRSISGAPVTQRAARIAEYVAAQEAHLRAVARASTGTPAEIRLIEQISTTIVKGSARYDYYNWVTAGRIDWWRSCPPEAGPLATPEVGQPATNPYRRVAPAETCRGHTSIWAIG